MTSTLPSQITNGLAPPRPLRRRRSSRLLLLGVVLAVLGALLGVVVYREGAQRVPVVAMARSVPFGQVVTRDDVREIPLPADTGLATVAWSNVASVIGRVAVTDLLAGQAITPDAVVSERPPAAGDAVVGVSVGPGRVPLTPLGVRDEVLVSGIGDNAAPQRATVLRVGEPDASGKRTVDLLVGEAVAVDLGRMSAEDRAVLVLVARR